MNITQTAIAAVVLVIIGVMDVPLDAQTNRESVRVRGHWVISVLNPDGSQTSSIEFDNALSDFGQTFLVNLLTGRFAAGGWRIDLFGVRRRSDEYMFPPFSDAALIASYPLPVDNPSWFHNLTISASQSNFQLTGTATATNEGVLTSVWTDTRLRQLEGSCGEACVGGTFSIALVPDSTPDTYPDGLPMPNGLHIKAGQTVEITVTISFAATPHGSSEEQ